MGMGMPGMQGMGMQGMQSAPNATDYAKLAQMSTYPPMQMPSGLPENLQGQFQGSNFNSQLNVPMMGGGTTKKYRFNRDKLKKQISSSSGFFF